MTTAQIDFMNPQIIAELERRAYAENAKALSEVLASLTDALDMVEYLTEENDKLRADSLARWERNNGPAESYKAFFESCFERLSGHYPCPSVTSDYDCQVIFEAIGRGEESRDAQ